MNKIVILNSKYSQLQGYQDCPDFIKALHAELQYFNESAMYSKAYQGYYNGKNYVQWSGYTKLLSKDLKFANGLLTRVKELHATHNIQYEIVDKRKNREPTVELDISENLKNINKVPFYYQQDVVDEAIKHQQAILRLCTSAGKTLLAALITAKINKPTVIVVISKSLLYQFHEEYSKIFNEKIGMIGDGVCDIQRITIATMYSLGSALGMKKDIVEDDDDLEEEQVVDESKKDKIAACIKNAQNWIIDECHSSGCELIKRIYNNMDDNYYSLYGMSATPFTKPDLIRKANENYHTSDLLIESMLGKKVADIPASKLIEEGFIAQPIIQFQMVPHMAGLTKNYQSIYKNFIVENPTRNAMIVKNAQNLISKGFQVLILYSVIKHGEIISEMLNEANIDHELLKGKDGQDVRDEVKKKLMSGESKCVVASKIFDVGVSIESLSALILASGGKSYVKTLQRVGRILRKWKNKKYVAVVDFYDNATYVSNHSKIRHKIYKSEPGFVILKHNIKELK